MESKTKFYILLGTLTTIITLYMTYLALAWQYPNGRDIWFHILAARAWYKGLGFTSPVVMDINGMPYAPLFHFMFVPFVSSEQLAVNFSKIVQTIIYPLGLAATALVTAKFQGKKAGLITAGLLCGTYYSWTMMQTKPESITLILFPVLLYATLQQKSKTWIATATTMFYIYSPIALAFTLGPAAYMLDKNKKDKRVWITLLLIAPILLYQLTFMISTYFYGRWLRIGDLGMQGEFADFLKYPWFFIIIGIGLSTLGLIYIPRMIQKWNTQTEYTKLLLYSTVFFLIMIPSWYDRVFTFECLPLAIFTASFISKRKPVILYVFLVCLVVQMFLMLTNPVWWMSKPDYFNTYW